MKLATVLIISLFVGHSVKGQDYRITYNGIPELYEQVELVVMQKTSNNDYTVLDKGYRLSVNNKTLKEDQLQFDRHEIHTREGKVELTIKHKNKSTPVTLQLPILTEIKFNLYADSIKPVLNYYLNVEGVFSNGKVYPLDTSFISISSNYGEVEGTEWIKPDTLSFDAVNFVAICKYDTTITSSTEVFIKKKKMETKQSSLPAQ